MKHLQPIIFILVGLILCYFGYVYFSNKQIPPENNSIIDEIPDVITPIEYNPKVEYEIYEGKG